MPDCENSVFEHYYKELLNFFSRRVSDRTIAADLAQETYARVYSGAIQDVQEPRKLLYKVAQNLLIDHYRREHTRSQVHEVYDDDMEDGANQYPAPSACQPEVILDAKQRLAVIESTVARLPPRVREAFVLYKLEGLSRAEVAEQMNISVRTVEGYLEVAMRACMKALQQLDGLRMQNED